jgi:hypothetical protein
MSGLRVRHFLLLILEILTHEPMYSSIAQHPQVLFPPINDQMASTFYTAATELLPFLMLSVNPPATKIDLQSLHQHVELLLYSQYRQWLHVTLVLNTNLLLPLSHLTPMGGYPTIL